MTGRISMRTIQKNVHNKEKKGVDGMRREICGRVIGVLGIITILCMNLCIYAQAENACHWYCKRTNDHSQPKFGSDLDWVRDYDGIFIDQAHGDDANDKVVYLTFDAGYENGNVAKILDVLNEEDVPGAFFILGNLINRNPDLVKRMADEGHLVCNHTNKHKNITKLDKAGITEEIQALENAYTELTGKKMAKYFRPPEGTFDKESLAIVQECGYKTVFWSFAYADWDNQKQMSVQAAKNKILDNLHNGEIMLLHPTSATNAAVLREVIQEIKSMGYRFGSLDEIELNES